MNAERPERVRLADPCDLREGFTHFVLAKRAGEDGRVSLVHPQRPAQAGALAAADCWLPPGKAAAPKPARASTANPL